MRELTEDALAHVSGGFAGLGARSRQGENAQLGDTICARAPRQIQGACYALVVAGVFTLAPAVVAEGWEALGNQAHGNPCPDGCYPSTDGVQTVCIRGVPDTPMDDGRTPPRGGRPAY